MRAELVLPIPWLPVSKNAFATLSSAIEFLMVSTKISCPIKSANFLGLYLFASIRGI
jgi:hypothetical protein